MRTPVEWHFWSPEQIVAALPDLLRQAVERLPELPEEHRDKNQAAIDTLRASPPTPAEVREGARSRDLVTLGFALDVLGRRSAAAGRPEEALALFQAAHEMFRGGNPLLRATKPMRQTLGNALRVLAQQAAQAVTAGEGTLGVFRERLQAFVVSAWGFLPPQLVLQLDELLLTELERVRSELETDTPRHDALVRDNLDAVLGLDLPTRLEPVRQRWEALGERVAPAVVRKAQRTGRRPERLSALLPPTVWSALQQAVERGDPQALAAALAEVEDELEHSLRLRLDARAEYREPASELRVGGAADPLFTEARALLLRRDPQALDLFNTLHYRRSGNTVAKEWYAYALTVFGRPTDIHDIINLLQQAIASPHFHPERGWTARWNLACALRRLPTRAAEALDVLLPVLAHDAHTAEAFELCLLWALEQNRQDVLGALLPRCRHAEAHLLLALYDAEGRRPGVTAAALDEHFRRLNHILREPDRVFPDPRERLTFDELDQLTREFLAASLVAAGIEWFRQRAAYGGEGRVFKNWECAAALNEAAGDWTGAWRCRLQSWRATQHKRGVDPRRKGQVLRGLLAWSQRHGFQDEALRILRQNWRETSLTEADVRLWEQRLSRRLAQTEPLPPTPAETEAQPEEAGGAGLDDAPGAAALPAPAGAVPAAAEATPAPRRRPAGAGARRPLALMLDWENIKISLADCLRDLPEARAQALRTRLQGPDLARRLLDAAWRHGTPRQRWAVADWDRPFFEGDQKAVRMARFLADIAGGEKFNAADHVLREKIHLVLREHPEIEVFVIGTGDGDFLEAIRTLQEKGKEVVLWATRRSINPVYGQHLAGPDRIRIDWLEDLVFGEHALEA